MMDEACRSDKHLGDGQVTFLTCFNFWYVCGALQVLFATGSYACVHTVRSVSRVVFMLFFLLTNFTFFYSLVSSFQFPVHFSMMPLLSFIAYFITMYVVLFLLFV